MKLLAEGEKFADFQLRTVDNSFGSWFAFDEQRAKRRRHRPMSKTSIAVWVGLYPTVVILTLAAVPAEDADVDRDAHRKPVVQLRDQLRDDALLRESAAEALAASAAGCARGANELARASPPSSHVNLEFWVVVFYLVTRVFWHLP